MIHLTAIALTFLAAHTSVSGVTVFHEVLVDTFTSSLTAKQGLQIRMTGVLRACDNVALADRYNAANQPAIFKALADKLAAHPKLKQIDMSTELSALDDSLRFGLLAWLHGAQTQTKLMFDLHPSTRGALCEAAEMFAHQELKVR